VLFQSRDPFQLLKCFEVRVSMVRVRGNTAISAHNLSVFSNERQLAESGVACNAPPSQ
jgi:hypothetical protein